MVLRLYVPSPTTSDDVLACCCWGKMLDYIDKLNELDTEGVEPMSHVFPVNNVFREDVVTNGDGSADTLANAPVKKDGGFKVPKTIS